MIGNANRSDTRRRLLWGVILLVLVAGWWSLMNLYGESFRLAVLDFLDWVEELGPWGPVFFALVVAGSKVVLVPGIIFTLGGGFLFGVFNGLLYVLIGTALGASISFFIGKYLCKNWVNAQLAKHARTRRFAQIIAGEGIRFITLTRMVPFFPFKLSNYIFGATDVPYRKFIAGTCIGIVPISFANVYAGSLASDLTALGTEAVLESPLTWALYGGGFVVAIVFAIYLSRLARRALEPYVGDED